MSGFEVINSPSIESLIRSLITPASGPCVSIQMPVHRSFPDSKQDIPRYRALIKAAREQLLEHHDKEMITQLLAPVDELIDDAPFWDHKFSGVALYASPGMFKVVTLPEAVTERAVVSDTFYVKPLIQQSQADNRFLLLALSRHHVRLLQGHRYHLQQIQLHESIPRTAETVPSDMARGDLGTQASAGGEQRGEKTSAHHGGGSKHDVVNEDEERFFRAVAAGVREHHLSEKTAPVLLAAAPQHQATFRKVAKGLPLLEERVELNVDGMDDEALGRLAWNAVGPRYGAYVRSRVDQYNESVAKNLGSDQATEIAKAASEGRVGVLLVECDRRAPGQVDSDDGLVAPTGPAHREVDTLLNDIAILALKTSAEVIVVDHDAMPSAKGLAAIYRYGF